MSDEMQDLRPFVGPGRIPPERTSFERRHGLPRPDLLREALEQLLAGLPPSEFDHEDVAVFAERYGVDDGTAYAIGLELWQAALQAFASDAARWPEKSSYLDALQTMLRLRDEDVEPARLNAVAPYFRTALRETIADHVITGDERAALTRLADELGIPADTAEHAIERTARALLDEVWKAATRTGRLTPEGVSRVRAASAALGLAPTADQEQALGRAETAMAEAQARAELERAYREREAEDQRRRAHADRERIEARIAARRSAPHLPPPEPTRIDLAPGETELWVEPVAWHELVVDDTDPFAGPRLVFEDRGDLHVTDRRLVFIGRRMMRAVALSAVTGGVVYPDAVRIRRRMDRDVFFLLSHGERVAVLADALARVTGWPEPTVESHPASTLANAPPAPWR